MLVVVVDGIDFRNGVLQCLEVTVEDGVAANALAAYKVADTLVGLVTPSADAYLDALDACGPRIQSLHVFDVVGLRLVEHVLPVAADRLAVGGQRAVGLNIDVEQNDVGEALVFQLRDGLRTFTTYMAADVDTGGLSEDCDVTAYNECQ